MERICKFLKDAGVYYLATVEGDQPRVRPFGTAMVYEGRLYIMLDAYPELRRMYDENDGNTQVLYFKSGTAVFSSFTAAPEMVNF